MKEKTLIAISIIGSLAGLFVLFLLTENIEYNEKTIEKINSEKIQDMIKVNGEVVSARSGGNATFIQIKQPGYIDIIVFNSDLSLDKGENVEVIGKSEEYNGKMEIIGHRIRVIE